MLAALLPLLTAHATLIAVKSTGAGCPSSVQISAAIEARLPGLLVPPEQSGLPEALMLTLSSDPSSRAQSFTLTDHDLRVRLRRELPPPPSADPSECPALAETVALMVERYLQELGYRTEADTLMDRRRWDLFAGATWRPGADGMSAYEGRLGLGRLLGARRRLALTLALGIEGSSQESWPGATGRLYRFPAELRLVWRHGIGTTTLELGPFAGVQLLVLHSQTPDAAATDVRLVPEAGVGAGLRIPLGKVPFIRLVAALGVAALRYEFVTPAPARIVAFGTERAWGKMGVEAGFSFW
jgi:hypothetical protein